jgi:hypothetical protein
MAGLTADTHTYEYGVPDGAAANLVAWPVGANQQLYSGAVALVSGSGSTTTGFLKNAATPGTADQVAGVIGDPSGGTYVQTCAGILGGTTDGAVWVNVRTGCFFFQSATGSSALSASNNGKSVYYIGENANGGQFAFSSSSALYPLGGVQLPQDPSIAGTYSPGSTYYPIKLNTIGGP